MSDQSRPKRKWGYAPGRVRRLTNGPGWLVRCLLCPRLPDALPPIVPSAPGRMDHGSHRSALEALRAHFRDEHPLRFAARSSGGTLRTQPYIVGEQGSTWVVMVDGKPVPAALHRPTTENPFRLPEDDCGSCAACDPGLIVDGKVTGFRSRMNVCPDCGNKRCPKAANHAVWQCSGSNAVGQVGVPVEEAEPCIFCEIVAGRSPATIVRDWPQALAIVPLNPVVEGHTLVLPKDHVEDFTAQTDATLFAMLSAMQLGHELGGPMNLITSKGREATQSVFHLHLHLVPRAVDDGLALPWYSGKGNRT